MTARRAALAPAAARCPLLLLALLAAGCPRLAGPEAEVAHSLEALATTAPEMAIDGRGALKLQRARFDRLLVKAEAGGLVAVATVDAEALYRGQGATVRVSYLGVERIPFAPAAGRPRPRGPALPQLAEIAALLAQRIALAQSGGSAEQWEALAARSWNDERLGRAAMLEAARARPAEPDLRPTAWIVRAERDGAEVLEERAAPDSRDAARVTRSRWVLRREEGQLRFASGLL